MQTIDLIAEGKAKAIPQDQFLTNEPLRHAPKIFHDNCHLQWKDLTTLQAHNMVRGLSPYPAAWTDIVYPDGKRCTLKIYRTSCSQQKAPAAEPGTIQTDGKTYLQIALSDGWLQLEELQIAGACPLQIFCVDVIWRDVTQSRRYHKNWGKKLAHVRLFPYLCINNKQKTSYKLS